MDKQKQISGLSNICISFIILVGHQNKEYKYATLIYSNMRQTDEDLIRTVKNNKNDNPQFRYYNTI